MPQSQTQTIGVPFPVLYSTSDGCTFRRCPVCGDGFSTQVAYAGHYQHHHQELSPLSKVLQGFMDASMLAWELADQVEKVSPMQHEVLKASAETLAECARALRSAMEESGLG